MLKFQCTHCGGRLAVQEKHLSRLAKCPDCGQITHPMAGEILAQKPQKVAKNRCDNCARPLGRLQRPRTWAEATVCAACYRELAFEQMEQDQLDARQAEYIQPVSQAVLVSTGIVRSPQAAVRSLHLPFLTRLPAPIPSVSIPQVQSHAVQLNWKGTGVGVLVGAMAAVAAIYILKTVGILLLWCGAIMLLVGFAAWICRARISAGAGLTAISNLCRLLFRAASRVGGHSGQ